MLAISGAIHWALSSDKTEENKSQEEQEILQREIDKIQIASKEVEVMYSRYGGDWDKLFELLRESLADRELRKDFFAFLRLMVISQWFEKYDENGGFKHPEDQESAWLDPLEWLEFPEFYDVAIQPRLSSDSLDLAFILGLKDRYKDSDYMFIFGAVISVYLMTYATLETRAGYEICQQYGGIPDTQDEAYYKIRDEVNRRLGLQKSFKEILEKIDGDPFIRIDKVASDKDRS